MKYADILLETRSTPVIVVDIQPAYHDYLKNNINVANAMNFLNQQSGKILMLINADETGLTDDSSDSCIEYWVDNGLEEATLNRCQIVDKGYGYLRPLMDSRVSKRSIIAVIREMYNQKVTDSRDLPQGKLQELLGNEYQESFEDEAISVNWISVGLLKQYSGCYIIGGAEEECLEEVQLLMQAFNIRYHIIPKFIY